MNQISVPVFGNTVSASTTEIGEPASIISNIKADIRDALSSLTIDEDSLTRCLQASHALVRFIKEKIDTAPSVQADSVSFELGISSTGKVAFLGTGVDLQIATKLQLTLKVL